MNAARSGPPWAAALAAVATVDACTGVLAVAVASLGRPGEAYPGRLFVACILLGGMSHALAPGWVLMSGPVPLHALKLRILAGLSALTTTVTALFVLLLLMLAAGYFVPVVAVALLIAMPFVFAGLAGLGAAWAQAVEPRTRRAAPPIVRAECLALGGAVGAWALPCGLWALGLVRLPSQAGPELWRPALLLGPCAIVAAAMPLNVLVLRSLAAAGFSLAPARTMLRRAAACCAVLLALAMLSLAVLSSR